MRDLFQYLLPLLFRFNLWFSAYCPPLPWKNALIFKMLTTQILVVTALVWWIIPLSLQPYSSPTSILLSLGRGTIGTVKRLHCPSGFWSSCLEEAGGGWRGGIYPPGSHRAVAEAGRDDPPMAKPRVGNLSSRRLQARGMASSSCLPGPGILTPPATASPGDSTFSTGVPSPCSPFVNSPTSALWTTQQHCDHPLSKFSSADQNLRATSSEPFFQHNLG